MFNTTYETSLSLRVIDDIFIDEIRMASTLGHFIVLSAYDRKADKYVPLAEAKERSGKYMIGFVAPTNSKLVTIRGYMEGPLIEKNVLSYTFKVGKEKGYLRVCPTTDERTTLNITLSLPTRLEVKLDDSKRNVDSHIVMDHLIPYLKEVENKEFHHAPIMSYKVKGKMGDLIQRVKLIGGKKAIKATVDGKIVKVFLNEGKIDYCVVYEDGQIYLGGEAFTRIDEEAFVEAIIYSIPIEEMVMTMV
ncbi:hypothetical protein [Sulfuracidifex tepidarius]|uniref:Uncharacterized protein n=1 Tax=Sulfuracidifex tepidarius TaxID=1294262 RepID=A0A510E125_9CREN|nr:hypothetical protein [Sulfuracidifex tepidarius]BBG26182.1 hypothetical protein IC007_0687 [Sulfuracidifex tepidarius]